MKNNLRRWEAKLRAAGTVTPARFSNGDDLEAWTQAFMQLEAGGWKGRAGTALACREDDRSYVARQLGDVGRVGSGQVR